MKRYWRKTEIESDDLFWQVRYQQQIGMSGLYVDGVSNDQLSDYRMWYNSRGYSFFTSGGQIKRVLKALSSDIHFS